MDVETYTVEWNAVEASVDALIAKLRDDDRSDTFGPVDLVVGIARGGIIPARLVAEGLHIHDIEIFKQNDSLNDIFHKLNGYLNIVFVDDINDTGKTFNSLIQVMGHIAVRGVYRMGALYQRYSTKCTNTTYGIKLENEKWLIFPWEKYGLPNEVQKSNKRDSV